MSVQTSESGALNSCLDDLFQKMNSRAFREETGNEKAGGRA